MVHRSHIGSKRAKARGWGRVPPYSVRLETKREEVGINYMDGEYMTVGYVGGGSCDNTTYVDCTTYTPVQTWYGVWDDNNPTVTIREIIKEREVTKEVEKRTLFRVYAVDPRKGGKVLMDGKPVIAQNENQAMLKAGVAQVADDAGLEIEQMDVYVEEVGTFIRPRKETQRVKIAKTDEDD